MALVFCNDGGSNTAPYETWDKAATTFLVAVDHASAGDDIIIGHDHTEDPGVSTTYTFPGTIAAPNRVISATSTAGGSVVTYNKADNIQVDNNAGTRDFTFQGVVHLWGVSFRCSDDIFSNTANTFITFYDSIIELSGALAKWTIGSSSGRNTLRLIDTDVNWSGGGATSYWSFASIGTFEWHGGTYLHSGTQPTSLFNDGTEQFLIDISGVDFAALTSAFFDVSDTVHTVASLHHCLLNSGVALTTGTINNHGTRILMSGCDDTTGNALYRMEYVDFWGSTVHDDDIFRTTGGASDGTTPISWKMVSTANAVEFSEPTKSPSIYAWVDSTGSQTFTVQCLWDSVTDIQDDEIWLEIEFLEASADTDSAFADDRMADITATPADQTTNATAWTETLTNDNEFALAVTVTVNRVGPVVARVCLAKPSTTVYVDPKIEIT